jgi:hypothetical protein
MKPRTQSRLGLGLLVLIGASVAVGVRSTTPVTADADRDAFIDRYMDVAEQIDPALAQRLQSMCQLDPAGFEIVLRRLGPMLSGLADLQGDDPELYQRKIRELHLEATVAALAVEVHRADLNNAPHREVQRATLQAQLEAMVRAQVLTSIENRQIFADRLLEHLDVLQVEIEQDRSDLDGTVQRRIDALTGS